MPAMGAEENTSPAAPVFAASPRPPRRAAGPVRRRRAGRTVPARRARRRALEADIVADHRVGHRDLEQAVVGQQIGTAGEQRAGCARADQRMPLIFRA